MASTAWLFDSKGAADMKKKAEILLCHNCGWNVYLQRHTSYISTVKCFYGSSQRGVWQLGDDYILKEQYLITPWGDEWHKGADVETTNWLRENTTIPVSAEIRYWKDQHSQFFLMKKVPGESLEAAWPRLSMEEKKTCAREVVEYLAQLRTHTAPTPQTVDGAPARDWMFTDITEVVTLEDKEAWWARVKNNLASSSPAFRENLKAEYPGHTAPYVLTHGDLNASNIMMQNGHVSGIIDWEYAGYYPDWWEYARAMLDGGNQEWKCYLVTEMGEKLGRYSAASNFCIEFKNAYMAPRREWLRLEEPYQGNFCDCKPYRRF